MWMGTVLHSIVYTLCIFLFNGKKNRARRVARSIGCHVSLFPNALKIDLDWFWNFHEILYIHVHLTELMTLVLLDKMVIGKKE